MTDLEKLIAKHEGLRLYPYHCSANKLSLGYGRNIEDNGISEAEALMLLRNDISRTEDELDAFSFTQWLNNNRRNALIDMLFNIGLSRFVKFKKMIAALEEKDYDTAAKEMLDSRYAKQVPGRAQELSEMIQKG